MRRTALLALLGAAAVGHAVAQHGSSDPEFENVPFQQWMSGEGQTLIRWTARVTPPILSSQQRLLARVDIQVDGAELARRRGKGQMMLFIQFNDEQGRNWQNHGAIDLEKVDENLSAANVSFTQYVFILPGDYRVSFAVYDTATKEHAVRKEKVHIAALHKDPLPDAWRDLPSVEFRPLVEPPDLYYLPTIARLHLPVETHRPVQMEVLVNLTPSELVSGAHRVESRNLTSLLPALKTISQTGLPAGSINVSLLDLSRRRVVFHQEKVAELDWDRMKASLTETDPGTIDVKSLQDRKYIARFFVHEVSHRINIEPEKPAPGAPAPQRVLIVLSSAMAFESGQDLQPIHPETTSDYRIFYIRFHDERARSYPQDPIPDRTRGYDGISGMGRHRHPGAEPAAAAGQIDQLEPTLKPLAPRLFDVTTPADFRKALAAILSELSAQ